MPPPQLRSVLKLDSLYDASSGYSVSRVTRDSKLSAGTQLAPFTKIGSPLIA